MQGKVFKPNPDLSNFIKRYWTLNFPIENTPKINTIIPDGTMKLIFHHGDLYWHHPPEGKKFLQPRCFLIGQLTRPYVVEPNGDTGTFVVQFHHCGFFPFADIKLKDYQNKPIPLNMVFKEEGNLIETQILNAGSTKERIKIIEDFLLNRLFESKNIDKIISTAVDTILTVNGNLSITDLSQANGITRRQLLRKFQSKIGINPKQLSKIIKIQAALKELMMETKPKLTNVAYSNDFYDQSHFIKEFKEFTGFSPKEFYNDQLQMSVIFDKLE